MRTTPEDTLNFRKRLALNAAGELGYLMRFPHVRNEIKQAKSVAEVERIMVTCRHRY